MSLNTSEADLPASIDVEIDTSGTRCPLPLLRAKQALKVMQVGEILQVLATDPAAKPDFDAMLSHLPHELVGYRREQNADPASRFKWIDKICIQKRAPA